MNLKIKPKPILSSITVLELLGLLMTAATINSCTVTSAPGGVSTFAGRVALFDSTGSVMTDFAGITVQLDGTKFQTTTNVDGTWQIDNVPNGQYNISATKAGFGTFYWYERTAEGGRYDLSTAAIAQMPDTISDPPAPSFGGSVLAFGGPWHDGNHHYLSPYVDVDSTVQPSAPHLATSPIPAEEYISINDLRAAGAQPGQTLYVSYAWTFDIWGGTDNGAAYQASFYDPRYNEVRYASNGPKSRVFKVVMPQ